MFSPTRARAYERGILLPVHATLTEEQIEHVCRTIREFYGYRLSQKRARHAKRRRPAASDEDR